MSLFLLISFRLVLLRVSGNVDKNSKYKAYLRLIKNLPETPVAKIVASLKRVREIKGEEFLVLRDYCAFDLSSKY